MSGGRICLIRRGDVQPLRQPCPPWRDTFRSRPVKPVEEDRPMKHRIVSALALVALVALVLALAFPVAVPAAPPAPHAQPGPAAAAAAAEKHHHIHEAIDALRGG